MLMHNNKTFVAVVTLLGIMVSLGWFTAVQAGGAGELCPTCLPVTGRLPQGAFIGNLTSVTFRFDTDLHLRAAGALFGKATVNGVTQRIDLQPFADIGVELRQVGQPNACDILILDFDPINVQPLDLDVDLSPIAVNSTSPQSRGYVLGQFLCELDERLNSSSPNWTMIQQLLDAINELLG